MHVGEAYRVRAAIDEDAGVELRCRGEVVDGDGKVCAVASATFVPLGPAQAVEAIGAAVDGDDAGFVRGQDRPAR